MATMVLQYARSALNPAEAPIRLPVPPAPPPSRPSFQWSIQCSRWESYRFRNRRPGANSSRAQSAASPGEDIQQAAHRSNPPLISHCVDCVLIAVATPELAVCVSHLDQASQNHLIVLMAMICWNRWCCRTFRTSQGDGCIAGFVKRNTLRTVLTSATPAVPNINCHHTDQMVLAAGSRW